MPSEEQKGAGSSASNTTDSGPSNYRIVKDGGWTSRKNFQESYGLGMDPDGIAEGNEIINAFREHDQATVVEMHMNEVVEGKDDDYATENDIEDVEGEELEQHTTSDEYDVNENGVDEYDGDGGYDDGYDDVDDDNCDDGFDGDGDGDY